MPTWLSLHYHLIFSTKHREPFITRVISDELYAYLGGTVKGLGATANAIGGVSDHVHLLVTFRATHCLADFMRELQKASSQWMKTTGKMPQFAWQEGYCALTVSASLRPQVHQYICNQEKHHRERSFRDELESFLKRAGIEYEPRFLD